MSELRRHQRCAVNRLLHHAGAMTLGEERTVAGAAHRLVRDLRMTEEEARRVIEQAPSTPLVREDGA